MNIKNKLLFSKSNKTNYEFELIFLYPNQVILKIHLNNTFLINNIITFFKNK